MLWNWDFKLTGNRKKLRELWKRLFLEVGFRLRSWNRNEKEEIFICLCIRYTDECKRETCFPAGFHRYLWIAQDKTSRTLALISGFGGKSSVAWTFLPSPCQFSWYLLFHPCHLGHGSLSQLIQTFYISHPLLWLPIMVYFSPWPVDLFKHACFLSSSQQISLPTIYVAKAFWSSIGTKIGVLISVIFLFLFSSFCPANLKFIHILWHTLS